ncbi:MAG: phosphate acyltransferase PlsX [Clostridia bacterium]|nr:phosphate acyltransferase PlsX [Clostridia bacterium]
MSLFRIAVDGMGGDNAPKAVCEGVLQALESYKDISVLLYGPKAQLEPLTAGAGDRLTIVDAPDVISMDESPTLAVRRKTNSSMVKAMLALKNGEADAFVSAGSTGAVLAGGILHVRRIHGIDRPALAPVIPGRNHPFLLIDSGANVDCQPEFLNQFGLMGSIYMEKVIGVKNPSVGLVNIGAEEEKGSQQAKTAHQLMKNQKIYRFTGNLEARDVPTGDVSVAVCDGFVGNVILKYTEGLASALTGMLKDTIMSSGLRGKIGGLLLKPAMKAFKNRMNYEETGGAPLLGVNGAMVKAHGSSSATAFKNAIGQARRMVEQGVTDAIRQEIERLTPQE